MKSQVETSLADEKRMIEKSRITLSESQRIGKENPHALHVHGIQFDEEIYDDRQFYSLLLKVRIFIHLSIFIMKKASHQFCQFLSTRLLLLDSSSHLVFY